MEIWAVVTIGGQTIRNKMAEHYLLCPHRLLLLTGMLPVSKGKLPAA